MARKGSASCKGGLRSCYAPVGYRNQSCLRRLPRLIGIRACTRTTLLCPLSRLFFNCNPFDTHTHTHRWCTSLPDFAELRINHFFRTDLENGIPSTFQVQGTIFFFKLLPIFAREREREREGGKETIARVNLILARIFTHNFQLLPFDEFNFEIRLRLHILLPRWRRVFKFSTRLSNNSLA